MTSPYVIAIEDKTIQLECELSELTRLLRQVRREHNWQESNVEDCLGTLGVNLGALIRQAQQLKDEIALVRVRAHA